jgi:hypothetical protein
VSAFVTAGAGFLLAVLWFDLMFDVQVARHRRGPAPEHVLVSIARYYARVTTAARPMNRLIAAVMLATLAAIAVQIARAEVPAWVGWSSLALALAPIALAGAHTVPSAVRLGTGTDTAERQSELARSVLADHAFCIAAMLALLVVQLAFG